MWKNRNDLAIRQQFRADFHMTSDTFMDIVTLVRNRLEKQDTRFRETVPTEKTVAIDFRGSQPLEVFYEKENTCARTSFFNKVAGLRAATLLEKRLWHWCFLVNFAKFPITPFSQNTLNRALKTFAVGKSGAISIIVYQNTLYFYFREPQVEQPKQLLNFKKPLTVKFLMMSVPIGLLEKISHNSMLF